ncbi:MAG: hypothetical protein J6C83_04510, partial [Peptococcaceae bacterium]|nr:hypothetical protein [Peptococcaceae bacterium]MBP3626251.1 hypothetical protein [Peptococcaceae bacterium]
LPYEKIKAAIDRAAETQLGCKPERIYMMDHDYKNRLFTERTRIDRGACGIKLPVVVDAAPEGNIMQVV